MLYPAKFQKDGKYFVVTFRDVPQAITQGKDWIEALEMAEDALLVSREFYFEEDKPFPKPSAPLANEVMISIKDET